jgi:hypothetical protein
VHNSLGQGQAAAPTCPVCLLPGNSWEQGHIAPDDLPLFFSSFSLSFNSLLPELVKLKHNAENGRDLQALGSTWTHHIMCGHKTSDCHPPVQISICLHMSTTLPTIMKCIESQKESCCKHLRRPGPAKHVWTQNLCLPPA